VSDPAHERPTDKAVLMFISGGLILVLLAIIAGLFLSHRVLPNWAENVLVSMGTAAALKLGDCIGALVQLASGKSVDRLSTKLADSTPAAPLPGGEPVPVRVDNAPSDPVPVKGA
jgi:hypothetical protein